MKEEEESDGSVTNIESSDSNEEDMTVDKANMKINRLKLCNKIRKLMHSVAYFGQLNF